MDLKKRWLNFCDRNQAAGNEEKAFQKIVAAYASPPRKWHALETHIALCLTELDKVRRLAQEPEKLELALWLHDSQEVNQPAGSGASEFASADFAGTIIELLDLRVSFLEDVAGLILATRHCLPVFDHDKQLMADIDLVILGKSEAEFDEYERLVRQEYASVPLKEFAQKRSQILHWFLDRPRIYYTRSFRARYEQRARANLERSVRQLQRLAR